MARNSHSVLRTSALALAAYGVARLAGAVRRRTQRIDMRGRVVVITGGSRGLGLMLAEEFGARGARIAICGRDHGAVERAQQRLRDRGIDVIARNCDVGR